MSNYSPEEEKEEEAEGETLLTLREN